MGLAISRMDVIKNETDAVIEIREVREGCYGHSIKLQPGEAKEVAATKFTSRSELSSRPAFLKIFVNEKETDASLSPHHFIEFSKIVFRRPAGDPQFTIDGIQAKLGDLRRIWLLGCKGRDYKGRQEETMARSLFPVIQPFLILQLRQAPNTTFLDPCSTGCDASTMMMKPIDNLRDSVTLA